MLEDKLIAACIRGERNAQQALYDRFSPVMYGVCKRYLKNPQDAEDVLLEAFFKVFIHIADFKGDGSFEGWIRRIVVNEALMFLRKHNILDETLELEAQLNVGREPTIHEELEAREILDLLDQLPTGYRTVFNLYVLEGFKHREIAETMGISINTSKSQLILAKKRLQELLELGSDGEEG